MKDSFRTIRYKDGFIHTAVEWQPGNIMACSIEWQIGQFSGKSSSIPAAKRAITKCREQINYS